jgi:outer membrane protein OmpA-like peptidoglycan-associated protein
MMSGINLEFEFKLLFDYEQDRVTERGENEIRNKAAFLKENPTATLALAGHSDIGEREENPAVSLSERRAVNVKRSFERNHNIDPGRITSTFHGSTQPLEPGYASQRVEGVITTH